MERADNHSLIAQRHGPVESRMRWKSHVRFGRRPGETHPQKRGQGAPGRSHVAQRCLDTIRRRVQQEQLGHRGRKDDPLYKTRKLLAKGNERLDDKGRAKLLEALRVGDPHDEVLGAWLAKEATRAVYLTDDINMATVMLGRATKACRTDPVPEIRSLGRTLTKWWTEILNHHRTGASNGPTEAMNLQVKKIKRGGQGFHCFDHYRLRVLLYAGGCDWTQLTTPTRPLRTRSSPLR